MSPQHIHSAADLVTPHERVAAGFLEQAVTKTQKVDPYLDDATHFKAALAEAADIESVVANRTIRPHLLAAAGFSAKAQSHLSDSELTQALQQVLALIGAKAHDEWRDEILYRFLLTKGDSLGGSMRNVTGALGGEKFTDAIRVALEDRGVRSSISRSNSEKIQSIRWNQRELLFDKTPRFIGKNIDVILLDTAHRRGAARDNLEQTQAYLACGEIKGGIDPAGADEHWKTANSALARIRQAFGDDHPPLFFAGAAIEDAMSREIFAQIQDGRLTHAANLTSPEQLADLASWVVGL